MQPGPKLFKKKQFGQNFLRSKNVTAWAIGELGQTIKDSNILEIGCGDGFLTGQILKTQCKSLSVIEIDQDWANLVKSKFSDTRLSVICQDFLKFDIQSIFPNEPLLVLANLPYNVGLPILKKIAKDARIISGVVMLQEEVAMRLAAKTGSSDVGFVTMELGYHFEFKLMQRVGPECFEPQPKVNSRLLYFFRRKKKEEIPSEDAFWKALSQAFARPRKTIGNNWHNLETENLEPEFLKKRAHQVSLQEFIEAWQKLKSF